MVLGVTFYFLLLIKETLGLNLGFGISLPPNKKKLPIDFNRLRKPVRAKYIDFDKNKEFNKKLYVQKHNTTLQEAPKAIESAINKFERACKISFENAWKKNAHKKS